MCLVAFAACMILIVPCGAASATDFIYASTNGSGVNVINTTSHAVEATIGGFSHSGETAISPDGKLLFVTDDQSVRVINTSSNTVVRSIPFPNANSIGQMAVGSNYRLYVTNHTRYVYIYDGTTGNYVDRLDSGGYNVYTLHLALSPDSKKLYVSLIQPPYHYNISAYDTQTRALLMKKPVDRNVTSLDAAGDRVYAGTVDSHGYYLYAYRAADLVRLRDIALPISLRYVVVKPDGSMVYVISRYDEKLTAVKGDLSAIDRTVDLYKLPSSAAISPGGRSVYTFCTESVLIMDTGDYSFDSFSTYYNVNDMEVVSKGLKFPVVPILPLPVINISPTPGPASITPVPPAPTLMVSPSSLSQTVNATPVATPSMIPDTTYNVPAVSPTARPSPGLEIMMAIACMAGAAYMCREKWK
jgi:YVTN family beta-propeller protein